MVASINLPAVTSRTTGRRQLQRSKSIVITKETAGEEEDSQQYGPMFHVSSGSSKPLMVKVVVNGKLLAMELDMGASASIVSEETFEQIREGQTSLELQ